MEKTGKILQSIFDSTNDVWFFIARDYSVLFFNTKAATNGKLLHNKELKAGDNILDYARDTKNNVDQTFKDSFEQALAGEHVVSEGKIEFTHSTFWFRSKFDPVYHDGEFIGISILVSDITADKLTAEEQIRNKEEIQKLLTKRQEFMSIASHELKTPVTALKGYIQILDRKAQQANVPEIETFTKKIDVQINKLTTLVNDLLDISRIEAGKLALNISSFPLRDILEDCILVLESAASTHTISMGACPDLTIRADRNRLQQVICNLLSNAVKYSPQGSQVLVQTKEGSNEVSISIVDEGVGLSPSEVSGLFNRFYRVDEANHNKAGLGLGLYISKEIIDRHQGKIEVESEKGKGSTFTIAIPHVQHNKLTIA